MHKVNFGFVIPSWLRVSFVVLQVVISILLSSLFMSTHRKEQSPTLHKPEEVSENGDVLPILTRLDPIKVTIMIHTWNLSRVSLTLCCVSET